MNIVATYLYSKVFLWSLIGLVTLDFFAFLLFDFSNYLQSIRSLSHKQVN